MADKVWQINSFGPWEIWMNFKTCNFQIDVSDWWLRSLINAGFLYRSLLQSGPVCGSLCIISIIGFHCWCIWLKLRYLYNGNYCYNALCLFQQQASKLNVSNYAGDAKFDIGNFNRPVNDKNGTNTTYSTYVVILEAQISFFGRHFLVKVISESLNMQWKNYSLALRCLLDYIK